MRTFTTMRKFVSLLACCLIVLLIASSEGGVDASCDPDECDRQCKADYRPLGICFQNRCVCIGHMTQGVSNQFCSLFLSMDLEFLYLYFHLYFKYRNVTHVSWRIE